MTSTIVFVAIVVVLVVTSSGWPEVKEAFFNREIFRSSFGEIANAFLINVKIFCIAEAIVLVTALGVAVLRGLPGPGVLPGPLARRSSTSTSSAAIPTILLIYLLGFGVPALPALRRPDVELFWGIVALVLVYTAYVSEVYRAGIESVHPSQNAAARSLGLSHAQALRHVVVPQAVRRVIPPLLNDFIGLQKDTALVGVIGVIEAFRRRSRLGLDVQLHAVLGRGAVPADHDPAHPLHRLPGRPRTPPSAGSGVTA